MEGVEDGVGGYGGDFYGDCGPVCEEAGLEFAVVFGIDVLVVE